MNTRGFKGVIICHSYISLLVKRSGSATTANYFIINELRLSSRQSHLILWLMLRLVLLLRQKPLHQWTYRLR